MYARVYICTYCDRKGHREKFCYDRLNFTSKIIWVHSDNNPRGPKNI